jgi:hypothetical protein
MGFDYGYSVADPGALVVWEAQFGDFFNVGQVIVDQFISSAEEKWGQHSGIVLSLPHGYEGQGPEHSSARLERFLTLCAEGNMQVIAPTTPEQYFHALRRQMKNNPRKPLVVMNPKSLLRHPQAVSSIEDVLTGRFEPVLLDVMTSPEVKRVIIASGKAYYDLRQARDKASANVAILRLEQFYPFPQQMLVDALKGYPNATEIVWVQEAPPPTWAPGPSSTNASRRSSARDRSSPTSAARWPRPRRRVRITGTRSSRRRWWRRRSTADAKRQPLFSLSRRPGGGQAILPVRVGGRWRVDESRGNTVSPHEWESVALGDRDPDRQDCLSSTWSSRERTRGEGNEPLRSREACAL